ncbi:MAG: acetate kinase [Cereibacter sp.]|jgi:acetate kinase|nr:acetate kinase [Cereibacter sp.]
MGDLLVVNAGSSSIKLVLFRDGAPMLSGAVTEIGGAAELVLGPLRRSVQAADHLGAIALCLAALEELGHPVPTLQAAAHRVVHGGRRLVAPCRVTPEIEAEIAACIPLAPLHNPHNLAAIRALRAVAPDLPQFASFDTAFHASNPEEALRYALPPGHEEIRRYGFHGISYAGLVEQLPAISGAPLPERLLALHLGNGASLCAIRGGQSVATTMGYSPLDGLTMGTRSGSIDGNAVLRLAELHGIDGAARILNRESGLLGLGGASDMRALQAAGTEAAEFAIRHFRYWVLRHAGSMIAAMQGLDAVAFTGGIGENDIQLRRQILEGLHWAGVEVDGADPAGPRLHAEGSRVAAWIVPAREEARIAAEARHILTEATRTA